MNNTKRIQRSEVGTDLGERMYCALALEEQDDFSVPCEVTGKWCKVRNFRPCTIRAEFLRRQGRDIYEIIGSPKPKGRQKSAVQTRRGRR